MEWFFHSFTSIILQKNVKSSEYGYFRSDYGEFRSDYMLFRSDYRDFRSDLISR